MTTAQSHSNADILLRAEAKPPRPPEGAEVLDHWRASLGRLFRAAGDFEREATARA